MSAPRLASRDALAAHFHAGRPEIECSHTVYARPCEDEADAILASGILRDPATLADDEALVMAAEVATARAFMEVHPDLPSDERVALSVLRALAAALSEDPS